MEVGLMAKLTRIFDGEGAVCQLSNARPGVLFDPVSGKPVARDTRKWQAMVERLAELEASRPRRRGLRRGRR